MRPTALRLKACAVLLGGFGLWWPGHFLAPLDAGSVLGIPFLAGGLAWGLAGLALITAVAATRKTLPAFAGLAVITLLVAYAHSVFATPGLFRATVVFGAWGPGIAVFVLATPAGRARPRVQAEQEAARHAASAPPCSAPSC